MQEEIRSSSPSRDTFHYAIVIAVTVLMMFWRLGLHKLDGHEAFVAVTAQTMTQPERWIDPDYYAGVIPENTPVNHWLIPVYDKMPRLVKTPLAYWCVAGIAKLGLPLNETTVRLPSAISAVLLMILTLALGRSMFSHRAALIGVLFLATSIIIMDWGRNARADMQMTLWMSLVIACFYWGVKAAGGKRHALFFAAWVALGLANLCKPLLPFVMGMPVLLFLAWRASDRAASDPLQSRAILKRYYLAALAGYVVTILIHIVPAFEWWNAVGASESLGIAATMAAALGLPVAWYFLRCRGWREIIPALPTAVPGVVIMLLLFVPWMLFIAHVFPQASAVFSKQTVQRSMGTGGWLTKSSSMLDVYYLRCLAKWVLPWTIFLPGALIIPFMKRFREDREGLTLLLMWAFCILLLLSASVGKREQYILPAVPAVCLLMGYCAEDVLFRHRWFSAKLAGLIVHGHAIVLSLGAVAGIVLIFAGPRQYHQGFIQLAIAAGVAATALWAAVIAWRKARPVATISLMVVAMLLGGLVYLTGGNVWESRWEDTANMARQVVTYPDAVPASWNQPDASLVWYADRDLPSVVLRKACLVTRYGQDDGERRWRKWLQEHNPPLYVIGEEKDIVDAAAVGLEPITPVNKKDHNSLVLMRQAAACPLP